MRDLKDYITFADVARSLPHRPDSVTIWRWATKGIKAPDGSRVKLRHVRLGGRMLTTAEWVDEFGDELAQAHEAPAVVDQPVIMTQREAERFCAKGAGR